MSHNWASGAQVSHNVVRPFVFSNVLLTGKYVMILFCLLTSLHTTQMTMRSLTLTNPSMVISVPFKSISYES